MAKQKQPYVPSPGKSLWRKWAFETLGGTDIFQKKSDHRFSKDYLLSNEAMIEYAASKLHSGST